MARIAKGRHPGQWKAYYWDAKAHKQVWVPAEVTRQWDGLSQQEAQARLDEWVAASGIKALRARRRSALLTDEVTGLVAAYVDDYAALREPGKAALQHRRGHIETYVLEYFVNTHGAKDVRQWWRHTVGFATWLRQTHPDLKIETVKKVCRSLARFGEYLAANHVIPQPWLIRLPTKRQRPQTPLTKRLTPDDVYKALIELPTQWQLFVLLGYFASLRPEEVYALERSDFITGAKAKADAKTYKRFNALGLGSGLSVSITKTNPREEPGIVPRAKSHYSYGVVNVWSADAAKKIAALLKDVDGYLFAGWENRAKLDREYKSVVRSLLGVVAYDFRRASGLYLGRERGLDPFLLQDHFRHSSMTTTLLYTRRPLDEKESAATQDLDDVS